MSHCLSHCPFLKLITLTEPRRWSCWRSASAASPPKIHHMMNLISHSHSHNHNLSVKAFTLSLTSSVYPSGLHPDTLWPLPPSLPSSLLLSLQVYRVPDEERPGVNYAPVPFKACGSPNKLGSPPGMSELVWSHARTHTHTCAEDVLSADNSDSVLSPCT